MIKKIGLSLLSIFGLLFFGTTFANPIAIHIPEACYKFENVEIDNYRVVVEYKYSVPYEKERRNVYEPKEKECTKHSRVGSGEVSRVFLLDKGIDIQDLTEENITDKAIYIGYIGELRDGRIINPNTTDKTYKITNKGDTYELVLTKTGDAGLREEREKNIKDLKFLFPYARLEAVLTETLILFFIAKLFWKNNQISNKRLLLFGVLPTTITLPLLRLILIFIPGEYQGRYVLIGELLVITIEAIMMKYGLKISRKKAIIASITCNILSFIIGVFLLNFILESRDNHHEMYFNNY